MTALAARQLTAYGGTGAHGTTGAAVRCTVLAPLAGIKDAELALRKASAELAG